VRIALQKSFLSGKKKGKKEPNTLEREIYCPNHKGQPERPAKRRLKRGGIARAVSETWDYNGFSPCHFSVGEAKYIRSRIIEPKLRGGKRTTVETSLFFWAIFASPAERGQEVERRREGEGTGSPALGWGLGITADDNHRQENEAKDGAPNQSSEGQGRGFGGGTRSEYAKTAKKWVLLPRVCYQLGGGGVKRRTRSTQKQNKWGSRFFNSSSQTPPSAWVWELEKVQRSCARDKEGFVSRIGEKLAGKRITRTLLFLFPVSKCAREGGRGAKNDEKTRGTSYFSGRNVRHENVTAIQCHPPKKCEGELRRTGGPRKPLRKRTGESSRLFEKEPERSPAGETGWALSSARRPRVDHEKGK